MVGYAALAVRHTALALAVMFGTPVVGYTALAVRHTALWAGSDVWNAGGGKISVFPE